MFVGMQEMVVVVQDMERLRSTLMDLGRWSAHPLPNAPAEQFAAWHVPEGCSRIEQMLMVPEGDSRGFLRLVRFHDVEAELMRPSQHTWDTGGIFDIDVYVTDARAFYRDLQRVGWTAFGHPTDYEWGGFSVCEALALGADGVVIGLLQPYGKILVDLPRYTGMSRAFNSAQTVRDYDTSMDFYVNVLGWKALVDSEIKDVEEPGRNVLGIPGAIARSVRRRVAILHPEGVNDGSVEIIEMKELQGDDFSSRCIAPNIGYLCARFPVVDASAYAQQVQERGAALYTEPMSLYMAPYGTATLFSVRTPDGAILEFYSLAQ
jgi:predicted enzyme related to lactoylglutathione lyase